MWKKIQKGESSAREKKPSACTQSEVHMHLVTVFIWSISVHVHWAHRKILKVEEQN